jgi:hypothetical protein
VRQGGAAPHGVTAGSGMHPQFSRRAVEGTSLGGRTPGDRKAPRLHRQSVTPSEREAGYPVEQTHRRPVAQPTRPQRWCALSRRRVERRSRLTQPTLGRQTTHGRILHVRGTHADRGLGPSLPRIVPTFGDLTDRPPGCLAHTSAHRHERAPDSGMRVRCRHKPAGGCYWLNTGGSCLVSTTCRATCGSSTLLSWALCRSSSEALSASRCNRSMRTPVA